MDVMPHKATFTSGPRNSDKPQHFHNELNHSVYADCVIRNNLILITQMYSLLSCAVDVLQQ